MLWLVVCVCLLVIGSSEGSLKLTSTTATCGQTTNLTCSSAAILQGDHYSWRIINPRFLTIYDKTVEGTVQGGKYNGTSRNGAFELMIFHTDADDAEKTYQCSHGHSGSNVKSLRFMCPSSGNNWNQQITFNPFYLISLPFCLRLGLGY